MVRPQHSPLVRTLTLLVLLWVGADFGAHGFLASDFTPIATGGTSVRLSPDDNGVTAVDHCFCHSVSMGEVVRRPTAVLTPTGRVAVVLSPRVPRADAHRIDRPPQLIA
jgi:hypothetical protein